MVGSFFVKIYNLNLTVFQVLQIALHKNEKKTDEKQ